MKHTQMICLNVFGENALPRIAQAESNVWSNGMNGNDFMAWVLRSPFHGMLSNGMMLITVTGRKTGKKYTMPVEYFRDSGVLWVMTNRDRTWWRNLKGGTEVALLLKRKPTTAFANLEVDAKTVEERVYEYVKRKPYAAKSLTIRLENGTANADDVMRIAKDRLFVRLRLTSA